MNLNTTALLNLDPSDRTISTFLTNYTNNIDKHIKLTEKVNQIINTLLSNEDIAVIRDYEIINNTITEYTFQKDIIILLKYLREFVLMSDHYLENYANNKMRYHIIHDNNLSKAEDNHLTNPDNSTSNISNLEINMKPLKKQLNDIQNSLEKIKFSILDIIKTKDNNVVNNEIISYVDKLFNIIKNTIKSKSGNLDINFKDIIKQYIDDLKLPLKMQGQKENLKCEDIKALGELIRILILINELKNDILMAIDGTYDKLSVPIKDKYMRDNIDFMDIYMYPLVKSIEYHFISNSQTNQLDKPEWMIKYIQELLHMNIIVIDKLELDIIGYKNVMIIKLIECMNNYIIRRYENDYKELVNDTHLYIHFIDTITTYEFDLIKLINYKISNNSSNSIYYTPKLFQNILNKKEGAIDLLINIESDTFEQVVFKELSMYEIAAEEREESKQIFDICLAEIIQNFTLIYTKLIEKYKLLSDSDIINKIKNDLWKKNFKKLMSYLDIFCSRIPSIKTDRKKCYILETLYSMTLYLEKYFGSISNMDGTSLLNIAEEQTKIKDFLNKILSELEKVIKKISDNLNKNLRNYLNSKSVLQYLVSKEKIDEHIIKKDQDNMQLINDFKIKINELHDKLKDELFKKALDILIKNIDKFLFDIVLTNYKFSIQGMIFLQKFLENYFDPLNFYEKDVATAHTNKLIETFRLASEDKNYLEEILQSIMELIESSVDQKENSARVKNLLNKNNISYLSVSDIEIISKMTIIHV